MGMRIDGKAKESPFLLRWGSFEGNSVFVTGGTWPVGNDAVPHIQWLWRWSWHRQIFPLLALFRNTYSHTPRCPLLTMPSSSSLCILGPHPLSSPTWKKILRRSSCWLESLQPQRPSLWSGASETPSLPQFQILFLSPPQPSPEPPLSSAGPCRVSPIPVHTCSSPKSAPHLRSGILCDKRAERVWFPLSP